MLVIYRKKDSTQFFEDLWKDINNVTFLDRTVITDTRIEKMMNEEKELVIICGEGDSNGLYKPNWNTKLNSENKIDYMISSVQAEHIYAENNRERTVRNIPVIALWTYSNEFLKANHLSGLAVSDFHFTLSDVESAGYESVIEDDVNSETRMFIERMNKLLKDYINHKREPQKYPQYLELYEWLRSLQDSSGRFNTGWVRENYFSSLKYVDSDGNEFSTTEEKEKFDNEQQLHYN